MLILGWRYWLARLIQWTAAQCSGMYLTLLLIGRGPETCVAELSVLAFAAVFLRFMGTQVAGVVE